MRAHVLDARGSRSPPSPPPATCSRAGRLASAPGKMYASMKSAQMSPRAERERRERVLRAVEVPDAGPLEEEEAVVLEERRAPSRSSVARFLMPTCSTISRLTILSNLPVDVAVVAAPRPRARSSTPYFLMRSVPKSTCSCASVTPRVLAPNSRAARATKRAPAAADVEQASRPSSSCSFSQQRSIFLYCACSSDVSGVSYQAAV